MVLPYLGNDPAKLDADPHWALHRAAGRGDLHALKLIISERRSDPTSSYSTADLELPLETSARLCNLELVSYLLDEGAIITGNAASATTCPFSGVQAHALPIFKLFRERGWNVSSKGSRGQPVFLYDILRSVPFAHFQILSCLSTYLILFAALADNLHSSVLTDETLVRWFLDNDIGLATVSVKCKSLSGKSKNRAEKTKPLTAVTDAANRSTTSVVSLLLSKGATLNHRVLHNAISGHGDDDVAAFTMFNFLLQQDPSLAQAINDIDNLQHPSRTRIERMKLDYGTPLHWAVLTGRKVRVEFLISRGADPKVKTPKKKLTPADWAKILGFQNLIDYFSALET
ncbi:MAG: hypothetical protein Q9185_006651 [Variospora sp. 1 TL-2023]